MIENKTRQAINFYLEQDFKNCLKVASNFRIGVTTNEKAKMKRAYECFVHPEFYKGLGVNIEEAIAEGVEVFVNLFIKKVELPQKI